MKTVLLIGLMCAIGLLPLMAAAQGSVTSNACQANPGTDISSLPRCINQIYVWSLGAGALLALLMVVLGGYYYMTAGGNAESASRGKDMIFSAIVGLVLLFGSYLILRTINPDLVEFKLTTGACFEKIPDSQNALFKDGVPSTTKLDADTEAACTAANGFWYSFTQ